jgi:hypothetical protein
MDPNLRGPAIVGDVDSGHAHQPNPRIGQLAFNQRFNLLAQSFANPPAMIFEPALLQDSAPQVKRMRITENWPQVCDPGSAIVARFREEGLSTEVTMC